MTGTSSAGFRLGFARARSPPTSTAAEPTEAIRKRRDAYPIYPAVSGPARARPRTLVTAVRLRSTHPRPPTPQLLHMFIPGSAGRAEPTADGPPPRPRLRTHDTITRRPPVKEAHPDDFVRIQFNRSHSISMTRCVILSFFKELCRGNFSKICKIKL